MSIPTEQYLTDFLAEHMEVAGYLGMKVRGYNGQRLALSIDLKPSLNDKLTAWGGSLYGLTVMNCWGMYYLKCREQGIDPNLVVSHGEIDYIAPVQDDPIVSVCVGTAIDWVAVFDRVKTKGKATVSLSAEVHSQGQKAVQFSGRYTLVSVKNS